MRMFNMYEPQNTKRTWAAEAHYAARPVMSTAIEHSSLVRVCVPKPEARHCHEYYASYEREQT